MSLGGRAGGVFELVLACGTGGGSLRWTYASGALRAEANGLFDDILLSILVSSYPYIPMGYQYGCSTVFVVVRKNALSRKYHCC